MKIGVPKEIKNHEYRIGLTPASVREIADSGHDVVIQNNGGAEIGFGNEQYLAAGAQIVDTPEEIFATADMLGWFKYDDVAASITRYGDRTEDSSCGAAVYDNVVSLAFRIERRGANRPGEQSQE